MSNVVVPVPFRLNIVVGFHPKNICCDGCPFCLADAFCRDRKRCIITDEVLYFTKEMGLRCPLVRADEEHGTEIQGAQG